jgi:hypothetical protein
MERLFIKSLNGRQWSALRFGRFTFEETTYSSYFNYTRLDVPQGRFGHDAEEKIPFPCPEFKPNCHPGGSPGPQGIKLRKVRDKNPPRVLPHYRGEKVCGSQ